MAKKLSLTGSQIESVGKKLDEFANTLNEDEKAIIVAILGIAKDGLKLASSSVPDIASRMGNKSLIKQKNFGLQQSDGDIPRLSDVFKDAFDARITTGFQIEGLDIDDLIGSLATVGVGGTTVTWSR